MSAELESLVASDGKGISSAPTPALTRAGFVDIGPATSHEQAAHAVASLRRRGYNTAVVPIMYEGEVLLTAPRWEQSGRKRPAKKGNPALAALEEAFKQNRLSPWLLIDPLAAGPAHLGTLGSLARKRREWLVRNSSGNLIPVGHEDRDPLFSWMNAPYRRFLGDLLFQLTDAQPVSGIIVDLRRFPGISDQKQRWYCCSFDSQTRAEEHLDISFEAILATASRQQVLEWQRWVVGQLRQFIEYLIARTRTARGDISWKILASPVESDDPFEAPWLPCLAEGLIEELIVIHNDPERDFLLEVEKCDEAAGRPALVMPCFASERDAAEQANGFEDWPVPGFLTLCPATSEGPVLPDCRVRWVTGGALEDDPVAALQCLAAHLEEGFGKESRLGRFYGELKAFFADFDPDPRVVDRTSSKIQSLRARLFSGELAIEDQHRALLREVDLMARLLGLVKFGVTAD